MSRYLSLELEDESFRSFMRELRSGAPARTEPVSSATCLHCAVEFKPRKGKRFCSKVCGRKYEADQRNAARATGGQTRKRTCSVCGIEFGEKVAPGGGGRWKYCGDRCAKIAKSTRDAQSTPSQIVERAAKIWNGEVELNPNPRPIGEILKAVSESIHPEKCTCTACQPWNIPQETP